MDRGGDQRGGRDVVDVWNDGIRQKEATRDRHCRCDTKRNGVVIPMVTHNIEWSANVNKICLACLLIICLAASVACTAPQEQAARSPQTYGDLWPVVVFLHDGAEDAALQNILLIVIDKSTGRSMKVTMGPDMFPLENFDPRQPESIEGSLRVIEERLQFPVALDDYVALSLKDLGSLKPGEAKEMSALELMRVGFSVLNSVETNLPMAQTVSTFQQVFAKKDDSIEISLPGHADTQGKSSNSVNWDETRAALISALDELKG